MLPNILLLLPLLLSSAVAHPGHNVAEEAAERAEYLKLKPRTIGSCKDHLGPRSHDTNIARRHDLFKDLRARRHVERDFAQYNFTHAYSGSRLSVGVDELELFGDNSSCLLQPEVTQGPYYVNGELIRKDVRENQEGVPLLLDIQVIDTTTCEPVPALYFDLWHCNATGVYSGVSASGNGDASDTTNLDNTFLRGIQQTDLNGVVQFQTIVPGHYTGRANHIHILAHASNDTTVRVNGTLLGSGANNTVQASHVGQLFLDQSLLAQVEAVEPYAANTQNHTLNSEDSILIQEADGLDPFVEYTMIGDSIEEGILAWISIGIDPSFSSSITSAATIYESGGVANENNAMGGAPGGGNMTGNATDGAAPSGAMLSGSAPARL